MKNLDLITKTGIIKDLEINFMTNTIKVYLLTLKLKIRLLFKTNSRSNRLKAYNYNWFTQHQDSRTITAASSNLDGGIKKMNFSKFDQCLNNMPPIQRKAFKLKTFGNNNTALICKELNINEAVFWNLIQKSRKELIVALNIK